MRSCVFSISCYLVNISKTGGVSKDAVHWEMVVKVEDEVRGRVWKRVVEQRSSELQQFLKRAQAFFQLDYCELSSRGEKESRTSSPWRLRLWGVECGPGAATHRQSLQSRETCRLLLLRPPLYYKTGLTMILSKCTVASICTQAEFYLIQKNTF